MSEENCPRCGHNKTVSGLALTGVDHWNCGAYRAESGNIYESELCETRQELRIQRELAVQFEAGAALLIVRAEKAEAELARMIEERDEANSKYLSTRKEIENMRSECTSLDTEMAKREKALNYLFFSINYDDPNFIPAMLQAYATLNREESIKHAGIELVEGFDAFAEWLKSRK